MHMNLQIHIKNNIRRVLAGGAALLLLLTAACGEIVGIAHWAIRGRALRAPTESILRRFAVGKFIIFEVLFVGI